MSSVTDYPEYIAAQYVGKIAFIVILVFGTVGNILSIAVWLRNRRRMTAPVAFLVTLAAMDLVVLVIGVTRHIVRKFVKEDIRNYHFLVCKITTFLVYAGGQISAWILVAITIERALSVGMPLKVTLLCTARRHYVVIAAIFLVVGGLNAHLLYGFDIYTPAGMKQAMCTRIPEYNPFYLDHYVMMHLFTLCIVPVVILTLGNIFILVQVKRTRRHTISQVERSATTPTTPTVSEDRLRNSSARISSVLTTRVVVLSVAFFLCNAPYTLYALLYDTWVQSGMSVHEQAMDHLFSEIALALVFTNNAINFYLFCAVGTKFRRDVAAMFRCLGQGRRDRIGQTTMSHFRSTTRSETSTSAEGEL